MAPRDPYFPLLAWGTTVSSHSFCPPFLMMTMQQLSDTKDKLVYTLADMENLRQRTARQSEDAKKFAVQARLPCSLHLMFHRGHP